MMSSHPGDFSLDLRFNWLAHFGCNQGYAATISHGMDWILRYSREMVSAHQSFSCVGFYAGPGPVSSFIKTINIKCLIIYFSDELNKLLVM